jgi:hypothetical protein
VKLREKSVPGKKERYREIMEKDYLCCELNKSFEVLE